MPKWEKRWGNLEDSQKSLLHLMLTYKNFNKSDFCTKRELRENYMSFDEGKIKRFENLGYNITLFKQYNTPNAVQSWERDLQISKEKIDIMPNTKVKMIMERKNLSASQLNI